MALTGKGFFIWKIAGTENGDVNAIASLARAANYSHVLLKVADGAGSYNIDRDTGIDLAQLLAQALHAHGVQAWGWQYVYGEDPIGEANRAIQRIQELRLDGFAIDAESQYKQPGKDAAARRYMRQLRLVLPRFPLALTSYRFPSLHPQLPWDEFLNSCDYNMPQVYWEQAHNPADQLRRCVAEFKSLVPYRRIIPVGAAYLEHGWSPTPAEETEFLQTCQELNLTGANFWEWANCRRNIPPVWDVIYNYTWSAGPAPAPDITIQYIQALNSHNPDRVVSLYTPTAVHVNAARTIQGVNSLMAWYSMLLTRLLPEAVFTHTGYSGTGSSRHFTWTATSKNVGQVLNGSDTFGLINGKIAYHYTSYSVTQPV